MGRSCAGLSNLQGSIEESQEKRGGAMKARFAGLLAALVLSMGGVAVLQASPKSAEIPEAASSDPQGGGVPRWVEIWSKLGGATLVVGGLGIWLGIREWRRQLSARLAERQAGASDENNSVEKSKALLLRL